MVNLIDYKELKSKLLELIEDICKVDDYGKYQELISFNNFYTARLYTLKQTELELKELKKGDSDNE